MDEVTELRVALTVPDFDEAVAFYRDALGLEQVADWSGEDGRVILLSAGKASIELFDDATGFVLKTPARSIRATKAILTTGGQSYPGSGTTGEVAADMGRKAILIESSSACQTALKDRVDRLSGKLFF